MYQLGYDLNRIREEFYIGFNNHQIKVTEQSEEGKATLDVFFSSKKYDYYFKLENEQSQWLTYGVNQQCADGIILCIFDHEGQTMADLFIFELKSKLSGSKWNEVLGQYRGSILRAVSFSGTLGVQGISSVKLYCCAIDKVSIDDEYAHVQAQKRLHGPVKRKQKTGAIYSNIEKWGLKAFSPFNIGTPCSHEFVQLTKHQDGTNIGKIIV